MADLWAEYEAATDSLRRADGSLESSLRAVRQLAARKAIEDHIRAEEAEKWREALLKEWVSNHHDNCGRIQREHDDYGCSYPLADLLRETYSDELTAITDYEARLLIRPETSDG
jgi:hypothetical protein